jgi:hypothetical protein
MTRLVVGALIRTTTSDFMSGRIYGILAFPKALDGGEIAACEAWLAGRSGVTL